MTHAVFEVVHAGSASRDLTPDDPRGWRMGGGVTYAALTTARLGLRTAAVIGVDEAGASADELGLLRDAGVTIELVRSDEAPVFDNRQTPEGRVQVCHVVGRPLARDTMPEAFRSATAWSLVPVAGEIDDTWASNVPDDARLIVGWQGLLRVLVAGERVQQRPPVASQLIARADLVGVSHHDIAHGSSLAEVARFLRPGADLLVTRGHRGGTLVRIGPDGPTEALDYSPVPTSGEIDPTGAGDTFLGALTASIAWSRLAGGPGSIERDDLDFAAAAGSLVVEGPGLAGVPDLAMVRARAGRSSD
jgi:sugar/nucleoside kinase (ribokinase family)